ncbi:MAG TPA: trehalose-6-phosphate synthase, partial [Terriglobia bacterium]|nr:trehalose-6-phosphate synthase [Terriglobia bacterium]
FPATPWHGSSTIENAMPETASTLRALLRAKLGAHPFVIASNREPYLHIREDGRRRWIRPASGLTVALDPLMRVCRGLWVAHGAGAADWEECDDRGRVQVPPDRPAYCLKRIRLTEDQLRRYYDGFANSALWPLCHVAYVRPVFLQEHWDGYREVNELFADRIAEELHNEPAFVFIQDYHLALLPRFLRERNPHVRIAHFWHIPWPNPEVFRICPWKEEILEGMLAADIIGFHIRYHCLNFIATVDSVLEARPDYERTAIVYQGHTSRIRAFPISIDFEEITRQASSWSMKRASKTLRAAYRVKPEQWLGLGVDRLDYTKGIPERLHGLDLFFERNPQYRGRLVFVQIGVPSREALQAYQALNEQVERKVAEINCKYGTEAWRPVLFLRAQFELPALIALYRQARFLIVSSLHDGMNLVAKEFIASQNDGRGVLILSQFTGAARELPDALLINPYSPDEIAAKIREAVEMDAAEVRQRMSKMRERVRENNIYKWAGSILKKLARLS